MTHGMEGGGGYDRHSDYQMAGGITHAELIAAAADMQAAAFEGESFFIADYGTAQGRVSDPLITEAASRVRAVHPDVPIFVCHNDVVSNDWSTLFQRLGSEDSYVAVTPGPVTPMVSATSFFEPVTPPGQVNLGMSFAAAQWLRDSTLAGSGSALYFDQLEAGLRAHMADRAAADLNRFLNLRAKELAPGGRMVFDMMGMNDTDQSAGHDAWNLIRSIVEDLVDEGSISAERLDGYIFPVYERSLEEFTKPFDHGAVGGLSLEQLALVDVPNPIAAAYARDRDAGRFSQGTTGFIRAFSEPSLRAGLDLDDKAIEEMYSRLQREIEDSVDVFEFQVRAITAVIARQ